MLSTMRICANILDRHDQSICRRPVKLPVATSSCKAVNVTIDAGVVAHAKTLGVNPKLTGK